MSEADGAARDAWVLSAFGIDMRQAAPADKAANDGSGAAKPASGNGAAMAGWKAAREKAVTSLKALAAAVDKLDYVDAPEAVILLRSIASNLTAEPSTPQQVAELRRYLETDDIIEEAEEPNGFGMQIALREPLLAALAGLEGKSA
jgi:hypothetical protein